MKYDKNRVFSAANAEDVKIGSRGIFADNICDLYDRVCDNYECESTIVTHINDIKSTRRFRCNCDLNYALFYLLEEPHEKLCTHRELAAWLARGNGEWRYTARSMVSTHFLYYLADADNQLYDAILIRKWGDAEWHAPTREYMGLHN